MGRPLGPRHGADIWFDFLQFELTQRFVYSIQKPEPLDPQWQTLKRQILFYLTQNTLFRNCQKYKKVILSSLSLQLFLQEHIYQIRPVQRAESSNVTS